MGRKILGSVGSTGTVLAGRCVMSLFLIPILTFYLLRDWDYIVAHLGALVPESNRETVFRACARDRRHSRCVPAWTAAGDAGSRDSLFDSGYRSSGLEFAIAIGVVSGLVSFVPYLGFIFGIAIATLTCSA